MEGTSHPAPTLRYFLLDVFTDRPFSGNQVAVFVDPGSLSDGQMQRIAAELALSETVFVWSPARSAGPGPPGSSHRQSNSHSLDIPRSGPPSSSRASGASPAPTTS